MHNPGTNIVRAVQTAAGLRAAGHSWAHIAATVGRTKETVRQWSRCYPAVWNRAAAEMRRDLTLGAGAEALNALRDLLRSEDDRTRRYAARDLADLAQQVEPADTPAPRTPFHTLADYLGGLSDEQHRRLLDREREAARDRAADEGPQPEAA
jgi:hypothetical protein